MAPFSIPAPCIIPLRIPVFGGPRAIDTQTRIELSCETVLDHEIFYTLDGTRPQPYAGIIQGSKLFKYKSPICLPAGKITIKALALNARIHTMRSSIITKTFEVLPAEKSLKDKKKTSKRKKKKATKSLILESEVNRDGKSFLESTDNFDDDFNRENCHETDEFHATAADLSSGEDISESLSEICSVASMRLSDDLKLEDPEENTYLSDVVNSVENEYTKEKDEAFISDFIKDEYDGDNKEYSLKPVKQILSENGNLKSPLFCNKCEVVLQHCIACNAPSTISSKFCTQCGEKLMSECRYCKELNCVIAMFCQSCGKKLEFEDRENEQHISYVDSSVMAKPQTLQAYVQQSLNMIDRGTQTLPIRKDRESTPRTPKKRLPSHSPGRGYWRQQLDYICNHLKSYAYNNMEFRDSISEPMLSEFQSVEVIKSDENVTVTVVFSPFVPENDTKDLE